MPRKKVTQDLADKNLPGTYGSGVEQDEFAAVAASVDEALASPVAPAGPPRQPSPPPKPFNRPTENPSRPITTGLSTGPGAGPAPKTSKADIESLRQRAYVLEALVTRPGATNAQIALYHRVRAILLRAGRTL